MPDDAPPEEGAVIDASALAAVVFREPGAQVIAEKIARLTWTVSTSLIEFEVGNVGVAKARRGELRFEEVDRALRGAMFPPARSFDLNAALALAWDHDLSYYDAAYLQLAIERDVPLFTLDTKLLKSDPGRCVDPSAG